MQGFENCSIEWQAFTFFFLIIVAIKVKTSSANNDNVNRNKVLGEDENHLFLADKAPNVQ